MKKNLKIFITSAFLSFLFFGFLNVSSSKFENFVFHAISENSQSMTAAIVYEKEKEEIDFKAEELRINAKAVISIKVERDGSKNVLFESNSKESLPIASLTKLMTVFVASDLKETYDLFKSIRISDKASMQRGITRLNEGETLMIKDLISIALIESSNDAAYALAELVTEERFVDLMNIYAKNLNLKRTVFIDSTGLGDLNGEDNYSTAEDLALFSLYFLEKYPEVFKITSNPEYKILRPGGEIRHIAQNTNLLLLEYPEIIGGKTGWTPRAGGCLILILKNDTGGYLVNVILGANDRFEEMRKLIDMAQKLQ